MKSLDLTKYRIYTVAQAAVILGVKPDTVNDRIRRGKYRAVKLAKTWLLQLPKPDTV